MNLEEFLKLEKPEEYDLKNEGGYKGNSPLELALEYRYAGDGFDCDGSGEGKAEGLCTLIREIYRVLWGWEDISNGGYVKRYAKSSMTDIFMGPETMNSFFTSLGAYLSLDPKLKDKYRWEYNTILFREKMSKEDRVKRIKAELPQDVDAYGDKDLIYSYIASTGKTGNMTLTLAGFNQYVGNDYWDIKLELQYFQNPLLSDYAKKKYVNLFFLWDYVAVRDHEYVFKPFYAGHCAEKAFPRLSEDVKCYMESVGRYIRRRGIFMTAMLRIAMQDKNIYDEIVRNVFLRDKTYTGYHAVLQEIRDCLKDKDDPGNVRDILFEAEKALSDHEDRMINLDMKEDKIKMLPDYEVKVLPKYNLSEKEKKEALDIIKKASYDFDMISEDSVTWRKRPPYKKYADIPCGFRFYHRLKKYQKYWILLEYYSYAEGDINGRILRKSHFI